MIQTVAWMHAVGAVAVVAEETNSALVIALVQTSVSLPAVLLAVVSGAVADIVDRRQLIFAMTMLASAALAVSAILTVSDLVTAAQILLLTLALGAAVAVSLPTVQAATPALVTRFELPLAMALNGVAINLARVGGPPLAAAVLSIFGPAELFVLEALMALLVGVSVLTLSMERPDRIRRERLTEAMLGGLRFARRSKPLRAVLIRAFLFTSFASAMWGCAAPGSPDTCW